ncbi:hypothetical protein G5B38_03095 [Pseudohalocynthiibacter aestuariivivens]|nr:hypothetical protein [Pseudohalocynthiibacter aestuariivivens]QIE44597.1 hypothetical protein G5B38_03095 [Pseudohalocynthiibacter aestuariivivens]
MKNNRLLNYIGLFVLIGALLLGWQWPWGLLFIYWVASAYMAGETHLLGPVSREQDSLLFWAIVTLWTLFGVLMVLADIAPNFTAIYLL